MKNLAQDQFIEIGKILDPKLVWVWNDHFDSETPPFYAINGLGNSNEIFMVKFYYDIDKITILDGQTFVERDINYRSNDNILGIVSKNELEQKLSQLNRTKEIVLNQLDKNGDGEIDLIHNDFNKLLNKHQKAIIEIDKDYIHRFIKVSNFIKAKKLNTESIFKSIKNTVNIGELEERINLLKNQVNAYEILVFHSINMLVSLVSGDLITFYEIYESFDKLGMFNSNWENEISERLANIGDKLDDLMYTINDMEQNIVSELSNLTYITQESFIDLEKSVTRQLMEIESSINTNNLLTGIQTYQLYKISNNTKGLRS